MGNAPLDSCKPCSRAASSNCSKGPPPACYRAAQRACGESNDPPKATLNNARLLRGAQEGDAAAVREAIDAGACTETRHPMRIMPGGRTNKDQPLSKGDWGLTPLMHAAKGGHLTCLMALLDARADVAAEDEDGVT